MRATLRLVETDPDDPGETLLVVSGAAPYWADSYDVVVQLAPDGDLAAAAGGLFATLASLEGDVDVLACARDGLGQAIMDRIERAASDQG